MAITTRAGGRRGKARAVDRERQGADFGESCCWGWWNYFSPNSFADDSTPLEPPQFLRPSTSAITNLQVVHELPPDQLVLAACTLDNGNAIVTITRDSINLYDPFEPQTNLQSLPLPHALQNPVAHQPHISWTDSHLIVHAPVSSTGGVRARTAPTVYAFDATSKQLFPLDLDAFDMTPVEDAAARKAGKRSALFCDSLATVALARAAVSSTTTAAVALPTEMDRDEDALYGAAEPETESKQAGAAAAAADGIVQPQELGAERWEWIAEIDSKGDLKVRAGGHFSSTTLSSPDYGPRRPQIRLLPSGVEVFSSSAVTLLPNVISDGESGRTIADNVDEDDIKVDRVCVAYVGKNGREALHLLVSLESWERRNTFLVDHTRRRADPVDQRPARYLRSALGRSAFDIRSDASPRLPLRQNLRPACPFPTSSPKRCRSTLTTPTATRLGRVPLRRRAGRRVRHGRGSAVGPQGRARSGALL